MRRGASGGRREALKQDDDERARQRRRDGDGERRAPRARPPDGKAGSDGAHGRAGRRGRRGRRVARRGQPDAVAGARGPNGRRRALSAPSQLRLPPPETFAAVFAPCAHCHEIGPGAHGDDGPPLTGVIGRQGRVVARLSLQRGASRQRPGVGRQDAGAIHRRSAGGGAGHAHDLRRPAAKRDRRARFLYRDRRSAATPPPRPCRRRRSPSAAPSRSSIRTTPSSRARFPRQAQRDLLRLHALSRRLPDDAAGPDRADEGDGRRRRQAERRVRHRRSRPRHAGATRRLSLVLRSAHSRPDRHGGADRRRRQGLSRRTTSACRTPTAAIPWIIRPRSF